MLLAIYYDMIPMFSQAIIRACVLLFNFARPEKLEDIVVLPEDEEGVCTNPNWQSECHFDTTAGNARAVVCARLNSASALRQ